MREQGLETKRLKTNRSKRQNGTQIEKRFLLFIDGMQRANTGFIMDDCSLLMIGMKPARRSKIGYCDRICRVLTNVLTNAC